LYREIIVKTLIGKGKYDSFEVKTLVLPECSSKTLGCWIINHQCNPEESKKNVVVNGSYDIQLWYATDNDQKTCVYNETVSFFGAVNMSWRKLHTLNDEKFIKVHVIKYPTAVGMKLIDEKTVEIKIESSYIIDVFAEAIVTVDTKEDDIDDGDLDEEIIMNVNPNYLESKK